MSRLLVCRTRVEGGRLATIPTLGTAAGVVPAFETVEPEDRALPFVFSSPHSGRDYPSQFLAASRLSGDAVRRSEDLFVDELFESVPAMGAPLLKARFPRAFLDVNREPYELDPKMFADHAAGLRQCRARCGWPAGLGTIPRIVAENEEIYRESLPLSEGLRRIEDIYKPFHARAAKSS